MSNKRKSKEYEKIDADEIAKVLGAKRIIKPKEIEEFKKKHGLPNPLAHASRNKKQSG